MIDADKPDAVVIVPIHCRDTSGVGTRMVVTKEFRAPLGDCEYGFPAGLIDKGETPEQAATRELKEETGYDVFKVLAVSPPIYSSAGMTDESVILVFVACTGNPTNTGAEAHEDIEILTLDCEQLARLLRRKKLKFGAKSWPLMMAFAYKGCAFLDPFQGY